MCRGRAGRGRKHCCKSNAQMAMHTNKGEDSWSPATALDEVIAGIVLAGGAGKANVGPVEFAEVHVHEQERGRTTGRRCTPCPSRGYRWRQACWRDWVSPLQTLRRWSPRNRAGQGVAATRDAAVRRQAQIGATAWVTATKMRARTGPNKGKIQTERACRGEANKISQQAPGIVAHDKKRPPTINSVRKQHHPYGNGNGHTPWSILLPPWLSVEESTCICLGAH